MLVYTSWRNNGVTPDGQHNQISKCFSLNPRKGKDGEEESSYLRPVGAIWKGKTKNGEEKLTLDLDYIPVAWDGKFIALPYRENEGRQDEKKAVNA